MTIYIELRICGSDLTKYEDAFISLVVINVQYLEETCMYLE